MTVHLVQLHFFFLIYRTLRLIHCKTFPIFLFFEIFTVNMFYLLVLKYNNIILQFTLLINLFYVQRTHRLKIYCICEGGYFPSCLGIKHSHPIRITKVSHVIFFPIFYIEISPFWVVCDRICTVAPIVVTTFWMTIIHGNYTSLLLQKCRTEGEVLDIEISLGLFSLSNISLHRLFYRMMRSFIVKSVVSSSSFCFCQIF